MMIVILSILGIKKTVLNVSYSIFWSNYYYNNFMYKETEPEKV